MVGRSALGKTAEPYVPLHLQSHFSLLHGTVTLDALCGRLAELGYRAAALADRDNLYAAAFFQAAARAAKIKPITGAEITAGPVSP